MNDDLKVEINIGAPLLKGALLDQLQAALLAHAPRWSQEMHIRQRDRCFAVDVGDPAGLSERIVELNETVRDDGRMFGFEELHGKDSSIVVYVHYDEDHVLSPSRHDLHIDNWVVIVIEAGQTKIGPVPVLDWTRTICLDLFPRLPIWHGFSCIRAEYKQKNMLPSRAVGRDISRGLPGLYWWNFFGEPYLELLGKDRLLNAPAYRVDSLEDAVLLQLGDDPRSWNSPAYKAVETAVLDHLGREHFFVKERAGPLPETAGLHEEDAWEECGYGGAKSPDFEARIRRARVTRAPRGGDVAAMRPAALDVPSKYRRPLHVVVEQQDGGSLLRLGLGSGEIELLLGEAKPGGELSFAVGAAELSAKQGRGLEFVAALAQWLGTEVPRDPPKSTEPRASYVRLGEDEDTEVFKLFFEDSDQQEAELFLLVAKDGESAWFVEKDSDYRANLLFLLTRCLRA